MRTSGVLLPIFSIPSRYGIGCFSKEAYEFIDLLKETKQTYWQVLPLGPTGFGDSPYQSFSTFAGNPYFVDIETLIEEGLLLEEDEEVVALDIGVDNIDYGFLYENRFLALKKAFSRFKIKPDYADFLRENKYWLDNYCLYQVLKQKLGSDFLSFPKEYQQPNESKRLMLINQNIKEINFYRFVQYEFFKQWKKLRAYANENGIYIIGDLPIYVSMDSAEAWLNHSDIMEFTGMKPNCVAGCPPDAFSEDGQLWGNPVYNWLNMQKDGYEWWVKRFEYSFKLYDVIRLDHFRGFDTYYCIEADAKTAKDGEWRKGPGMDFFETVTKKLVNRGVDMKIIAEDLGLLTDSVRELLESSKYPGMKVLHFAFYGRESTYLPCHHIKNAVVYTGTHDNQLTNSWIKGLNSTDKQFLREYINVFDREVNHWDIIRLAMGSASDCCIIPFGDYLGLEDEARINKPGTLGDNWKWRYKKEDITDDVKGGMEYYTSLYRRSNIHPEEKLSKDKEKIK